MTMPARVLLAALLALVALPAGTASAGTQSCPGAGAVPTARTLDDARDATVCLLNRERTKRGLRALRTNGVLQSSATSYAQDMVRRNFFAHVSPTGETLTQRIKDDTRYLADARGWEIGENIAWGTGSLATPAQIVASWMASPPHRANILRAGFREMGLGIALGAPVAGASAAAGAATYANQFGRRG